MTEVRSLEARKRGSPEVWKDGSGVLSFPYSLQALAYENINLKLLYIWFISIRLLREVVW